MAQQNSLPSLDVVANALEVGRSHPTVWFANFPRELTDSQKALLQQHEQNMLDYRCYSSLKWWGEVFQKLPPSNDSDAEVSRAQSQEFGKTAWEEMKTTSWLEKVNDDWIQSNSKQLTDYFQATHLLYEMGINVNLDAIEIAAMDPVATEVMNCIKATTKLEGAWLLVTEKYEFMNEDSSIKSYLRLLRLEVKENWMDLEDHGRIVPGVNVDAELWVYEILFDSEKWQAFASSLDMQQKDAMKDFVDQQTIEVEV